MNFFLVLTFLVAITDWYAVYRGWKKLEYVLKPTTMIFLFAWLVSATSLQGIALWFGLGIALSMLGDIFLMLPKQQFIAGLVAFLLAHVAYIIGFNPSWPPFTPLGLFFIIFVAAIGKELYKHISAGLAKRGEDALQKPVMAYTAVIALMQISALLTFFRTDWSFNTAFVVSLGAALFMLSDAILAWDKFVEPIKYGRVRNMSAYHLGQIILMLGIWMQTGS